MACHAPWEILRAGRHRHQSGESSADNSSQFAVEACRMLYLIFVALQDAMAEMGPTCFLVGTQTEEVDGLFNCRSTTQKDRVVKNSEGRLATLNKGDCVVFNARTLHCGNANESTKMRALFNALF
ncbi:hypothetical protein ACHAW6_000253 [Cyclotella cf. meneghiniana]